MYELKKSTARILSKLTTDFALKAAKGRKTIVGAMPVPNELRKSE